VPVSTRRIVLIAIAGALPLVLAVAGLFLLRDAEAGATYRGSRPPAGMTAADFELRSYTGREVRLDDLHGRALALTFLDAQCEESCPVIAAAAPRALARLDAADRKRVAFVAISTDPVEDTPAAVRAFLRRYKAEGALEYLVGPADAVRRTWRNYGVLASEKTGSDTMHSAPVRIYTPDGEWVSSLGAGADLTPRNLAHDIQVAIDTR
jgi:cytochrome oxidase Cu insertion factor (SCO1/SenC/PrrC family)